MNIYDKRKAFSLQQKVAILILHFEFQRELKNLVRTLETDREL